MEGNLTAVCSSQKWHYRDFVYPIVYGDLDSLKWFNSLLRKAQVYQVIEMTSNTVIARETSDTNYPWVHTSHLQALSGPVHCSGPKVCWFL